MHIRLRHLQQQLHRAGQLRISADQRRPGRTAEPAADERAHVPAHATESSDANQCFDNRYQNGDLDFDGLSYQASAWPNGTRNHPTAFEYAGPFQAGGKPYPQIQFETNVGASEILCDTATGSGCTVPPQGSKFYPFWSLSRHPAPFASDRTGCAWNFGNVLPNTFKTFGKDAQYGTPDVARFAGTSTSPVQANPEFAGGCRFL